MGASIWNPGSDVPLVNPGSAAAEQRFVATAGQVLFTLTAFNYTLAANALHVFVNGVRQSLVDFVETSTSSFTLTSGADAGDIVVAEGVVGVAQVLSNAASAVSVTPAGSIASTTVQTALEELDATITAAAAVKLDKAGNYAADIAGAATVDLTTVPSGGVVRITGIAATSAVTLGTGQTVTCIAVGAWPLTHHATTNPLPGSASYTCAAGDVVRYHKDGSGVIHVEIIPVAEHPGTILQATAEAGTDTTPRKWSAQRVAQAIAALGYTNTSYGEILTVVNVNAAIPLDDTIPQNTEGVEIVTAIITPKVTGSKIRCRFSCFGHSTIAGAGTTAALFVDTGANAIHASLEHAENSAGWIHQLYLEKTHAHGVSAGVAVTYKIRVGTTGGGNYYVNGAAAGARLFGGVAAATLVLEEVAA